MAAWDAGIKQPPCHWPAVLRTCRGEDGETVRFLFNYSDSKITVPCHWQGRDLLTGRAYSPGDKISLPEWGVCILV